MESQNNTSNRYAKTLSKALSTLRSDIELQGTTDGLWKHNFDA